MPCAYTFMRSVRIWCLALGVVYFVNSLKAGGEVFMANKLSQIQNMIYEIRGQKVMLDSNLAVLYGVELRSLNQAVKRNIKRFPSDFMFQLTDEEWDSLRSQIVTSKNNRGDRRYAPTMPDTRRCLICSKCDTNNIICIRKRLFYSVYPIKSSF